jgi:hypothetical protein
VFHSKLFILPHMSIFYLFHTPIFHSHNLPPSLQIQQAPDKLFRIRGLDNVDLSLNFASGYVAHQLCHPPGRPGHTNANFLQVCPLTPHLATAEAHYHWDSSDEASRPHDNPPTSFPSQISDTHGRLRSKLGAGLESSPEAI